MGFVVSHVTWFMCKHVDKLHSVYTDLSYLSEATKNEKQIKQTHLSPLLSNYLMMIAEENVFTFDCFTVWVMFLFILSDCYVFVLRVFHVNSCFWWILMQYKLHFGIIIKIEQN